MLSILSYTLFTRLSAVRVMPEGNLGRWIVLSWLKWD